MVEAEVVAASEEEEGDSIQEDATAATMVISAPEEEDEVVSDDSYPEEAHRETSSAGEDQEEAVANTTEVEDEGTDEEVEAAEAVTTTTMVPPVEGEWVECPAIPRWAAEAAVRLLPEDRMLRWPIRSRVTLISGGTFPMAGEECHSIGDYRLIEVSILGEGISSIEGEVLTGATIFITVATIGVIIVDQGVVTWESVVMP